MWRKLDEGVCEGVEGSCVCRGRRGRSERIEVLVCGGECRCIGEGKSNGREGE